MDLCLQRYDVDRSGYLDPAELATLLADLKFDSADIRSEFRQADKSGDGKIDFNEFVTYYNNIKLATSVTGGVPAIRFEAAPRARQSVTGSTAAPASSRSAIPVSARSDPAPAGTLESVFLVSSCVITLMWPSLLWHCCAACSM